MKKFLILIILILLSSTGYCNNSFLIGTLNHISGIEYESVTQKGITDTYGHFKYIQGEKITFKIGNLIIGETIGKDNITLLDLIPNSIDKNNYPSIKTIKTSILLYSLDEDNDPTNGIQITEWLRNKFNNITQTQINDDTDLDDLIKKLDIKIDLIDQKIALENLLSSLSEIYGTYNVKYTDGPISEIHIKIVNTNDYDIPFTIDTNTHNIPISIGSGLCLKFYNNNKIIFYALTDRGPNTPGPSGTQNDPAVKTTNNTFIQSVVFPVPEFTPQILEIEITDKHAKITKSIPIKNIKGEYTSGRPIPPGEIGSTLEAPLSTDLSKLLDFDSNGIDPEGIAIDKDGNFWIADEYGPFILKVDSSGKIIKKYSPGLNLPHMLTNRIPNRGFEGITIDPNTGLVYAIMQTPLKGNDSYICLVELDPNTDEVNLYAIPFENIFKPNQVKIGDIVSLGDGQFLIIERDKVVYIVKVDISCATKITKDMYESKQQLREIENITPAKTKIIVNLAEYGFPLKAEGLTVIDEKTFAITNDNDFGISAISFCTLNGEKIYLDPAKLRLEFTNNSPIIKTIERNDYDKNSIKYTITKGSPVDKRSRLWIVKLTKPIKEF